MSFIRAQHTAPCELVWQEPDFANYSKQVMVSQEPLAGSWGKVSYRVRSQRAVFLGRASLDLASRNLPIV